MRYLTYIVTLLAYTTVHIMRMSLPFVQLKLMQFFQINKFQMGIANACLYIVIGLSYLWRAFWPIKERQWTYFWSMNVSNLCYLIIPMLVYLHASVPALFYLCLAGFGWFQTASWPVLLSLVHAYFLPKRDGCMLGLWSANGDIGNIVGFLICTIVIYTLGLPFQVCLIIAAVFSFLMTLSVYRLQIDPTLTTKKQQIQQQLQQNQQPSNLCTHYKQILKQPLIIFMLLMLCMLKAILYGILLWLPMYFDKEGFKEYEGYIPISMNLAAILGSVVLGFFYEKIGSKVIRACIFMLTLIVTGVCFFLVQHIQFTVENRIILLILISMIGFCIMGNFNILSAHEVSSLCDRLGFQITAFSSLVMAMGNLFVGVVQFIIGNFASDDSNSVFSIFFVMTIVLIVLEAIRALYLYCETRKQKQKQIDSNKIPQNEVQKIEGQQSQLQ